MRRSYLNRPPGLLFLAILVAFPALAAGRHVFLDTDGDGKLNQCPNPAHNTFATPATGNIQYCPDGPDAGKVLGDKPGYVSSCGLEASAVDLPSNVQADVDGDGRLDDVYGHPQACVWNMAQSDSCEIHAGVYTKPGAVSTSAMVSPAGGMCQRSECWQATLVAFGNGPNMGSAPGTGYGVIGNPGYVRGAVMAASTDTWDQNGNKVPDCSGNTGARVCWGECAAGTNPGQLCTVDGNCPGAGATCDHTAYADEPTSYPAVFDGDANGNGIFWESTTCTDAACSGDSFYAAILGCGHENENASFCVTSLGEGQKRPLIDANADGSFDMSTETLTPEANWNSSYLTVKDIEMRHYNGGPATCDGNGIRDYVGSIQMSGGNATVAGKGYAVDRIFWHDGFYSRMCADEAFTSIIGDNENHYSIVPEVLSNSFIISGNRFVINDDCGEYGECGASKIGHDNRIVFPAKRADGNAWHEGPYCLGGTGIDQTCSGDGDCPGSTCFKSSGGEYQAFLRTKSLDSVLTTSPKVFRWYNNEFIFQNMTQGDTGTSLIKNECFGRCFHAKRDFCHGGDADGQTCGGGQGSACGTGGVCGGICAGGTSSGLTCPGLGTTCGTGGVCGGFWGPGQGQMWFYGNIVRFQGTFSHGWSRFAESFCTIDPSNCPGCDLGVLTDSGWSYYAFNNTWDVERPDTSSSSTTTMDYICNRPGKTYVSKNNAFYKATSIHTETVASGGTLVKTNNRCSDGNTNCRINSGGRAAWWTAGTKGVGIHAGLANYIPNCTGSPCVGPLYEKTANDSCDPDGDGNAGVDYDGDGVNDTTWNDLAGNRVNCCLNTDPISIGAIQPKSNAGSCVRSDVNVLSLRPPARP